MSDDERGVNPPCRECGFDGYSKADERGTFCPKCGNRHHP